MTKKIILCKKNHMIPFQKMAVTFKQLSKVKLIASYSFPLETQAQEWDSNSDSESSRTAGPKDQGAACPRFPGAKPRKLKPRRMAQMMKQAKPKESLHQIREQSRRLMEAKKFLQLAS